MTEVDKILTPDFLLRMVAIEAIQYCCTTDDSKSQVGPASVVELIVVVIEPTQEEKVLSENTYLLKLLNVSLCEIDLGQLEGRSLEFDTDEIILKKVKKSKDYSLIFINASTEIRISFNDLTVRLQSKREFVEK